MISVLLLLLLFFIIIAIRLVFWGVLFCIFVVFVSFVSFGVVFFSNTHRKCGIIKDYGFSSGFCFARWGALYIGIMYTVLRLSIFVQLISHKLVNKVLTIVC